VTLHHDVSGEGPRVGESIGPYRLLSILGRGGMGEVFLAEDTRLGRQVAIKTLAPKLSNSDQFASYLLREARAAARLNHPNIARVYDVIASDGRMHIVMESLDGETLAQRLRSRGPMPAADASAVCVQIASALEHAHANGILHCDVKPGNVFVTSDATVKVLDFGIARVLDAATDAGDAGIGASPTLMRLRVGTPPYMSPEQRLGRNVDQRSDVYGLGIVLHELCSGRLPAPLALDGDTTATDPELVLESSIDEPLRAIIDKATKLAPHDRYESIGDLKKALQELSPDARPVAVDRWWRRVAPRGWMFAAAVLTAAVALIGWLAGDSWRRNAADPAPPPVIAIAPFSVAEPSTEMRFLAAGITELVTDYLSASPTVVVISNNAMRALSSQSKPLDVMSKDLGATHVIAGSLTPQDGRVRVSLSVFNAATGRIESAGSIDASFTDVIGDSRSLTQLIRQRLNEAGIPAGAASPQLPSMPSRAALEDYAHGRELLAQFNTGDNLDRAIDLFKRAIERDRGFALAHAGFAEASWRKYRRTRDDTWAKTAQDATFEALRLAPEEARVRYTAAIVLRGTGRVQEAVEELRRALQLQPNYADAHRVLGTILATLGKLDEAVREFEAALKLQPASWETYHALGLAYFDHGRLEDAIRAFKEETRLQPGGAAGFQALGTSYHSLGKLDEALESYNRAIQIAPSALAYSNIGMILYNRKRYAEAVDAYRHSATLAPNIPETQRNLGDSLTRLGDAPGARQAYRRAIDLSTQELKINPRDGKLIALTAVCFAKLGEVRLARTSARSAVATASSDAEVHYLAGVALALAGDLEQASSLIQRSLELGFSRSVMEEDDDLTTLRKRGFLRKLQ
jgi:serine/threonine-protein kinase